MAIKQATVKKRKAWTPAMLDEKAKNQKARKRNRADAAETPRTPKPRRKPGEKVPPPRRP